MATSDEFTVGWRPLVVRAAISLAVGVALAVVCATWTGAQTALRALCAPLPNPHFAIWIQFPDGINLVGITGIGFIVCLIGLSTQHQILFSLYATVTLVTIGRIVRRSGVDANPPLRHLLLSYGAALGLFVAAEALVAWRRRRLETLPDPRAAIT